MTVSQNAGYALSAGEGKAMAWFGATITLKASTSGIGVTEVTIAPGDEPPLHVHKNEDEWFHLIRGQVTFHVGGQNLRGGPGAFVSFPRGIPHTFTVETASAHFLVMNTPGGFERMFERAPKNADEAVRAFKAFDIDVVGPHPRQASAHAS